MSESLSRLEKLKRPKLLIRAARIGAAEYDRARHLPRDLRLPGASPVARLDALLEAEAEADARRRARDGTYSAQRHVEILIALLGEAKLLARAAPDQPKASGIEALRSVT